MITLGVEGIQRYTLKATGVELGFLIFRFCDTSVVKGPVNKHVRNAPSLLYC